MNLAPTPAPAATCPPDRPVPLDPLSPGRHSYLLTYDEPSDWRGDRFVIATFENGAFSARGVSGPFQSNQGVEQLRKALLALDPVTDRDAASLPPRWHRNPKSDAGSFAFGITHLRDDGRRIAYTDMAGSMAAASPATQQVLAALRLLTRA
ncbi:MAG: hypothetical protein JWL76_441 [Thermoleophilia bacterium]|nr:hypothetical protein [Thermoleophilia bacterium]